MFQSSSMTRLVSRERFRFRRMISGVVLIFLEFFLRRVAELGYASPESNFGVKGDSSLKREWLRVTWSNFHRAPSSCDETSSLLEGKTADCVREVLERAAQRLFSDDAGLYPQHRTRFYVGVLPPLARIVRNMSETEVGVLSPQLDSATIEPRPSSRISAGMARG
ncbi:uncharacterized protein F5891DRAFT_1171501 [Suillus fuscotomentosus]|uniref:Uncharacterized protein n=1 Tax=Suillus fuscotomentosus TaxID=1912939 RepID=A0AAD4HNN7_9AGAM|nr:uncharacterized protein F5891DRAFT_1171501 [Suillus fuscotomentosus]KAG1903298.1 hypothetical protein F5891DRAFT_1171501 [Suillus fuscotomentosus]